MTSATDLEDGKVDEDGDAKDNFFRALTGHIEVGDGGEVYAYTRNNKVDNVEQILASECQCECYVDVNLELHQK